MFDENVTRIFQFFLVHFIIVPLEETIQSVYYKLVYYLVYYEEARARLTFLNSVTQFLRDMQKTTCLGKTFLFTTIFYATLPQPTVYLPKHYWMLSTLPYPRV